MINVSAPGKLFLVGEYVVLEGAPAILASVDRRVQVSLKPSTDDHWHIHAPDIGIDALELGTDGHLPDTLESATRGRLGVYAAVHAHVAAHIGTPTHPVVIDIDSQAFSRNGHKLGLGSSAAVASCLVAALAHAAGHQLGRDALCQHAIAAHRRAQDGSGSGADVATSIYGGVIEYRAGVVQATREWPAGVTGMAVVTGDGASTLDLLQRVRAYAKRDPTGYDTDMRVLRRLAANAHNAMAECRTFLALAREYFNALETLGQHAQAGIVLPRHRELAALAAQHDGVFKTSGAGGGDLGLAFAHSGKPARQLAAALTGAGAQIVPLHFGASGLKID